MVTPYYAAHGVEIHHGDVLEVVPSLDVCDALITDPPYSSGGAFRADRAKQTSVKYSSSLVVASIAFAGDNRDGRSFLAWCSLWLSACFNRLADHASALVWSDWRQVPTLSDALQCGGFTWGGLGVWHKKTGRPERVGFGHVHELVLHGVRGSRDAEAHAYSAPGVFLNPLERERVHLAQKPLAVMEWLVPFCPEGGRVLDPFMGSGSTLLAAQNLGRRAVGIDADERWCETAAERVEANAARLRELWGSPLFEGPEAAVEASE